jgi:exonuclease III
MRIATYNVNGINGRLGNLLGWLDETAPDIVYLQELKAPDEKFPAPALRATAPSGTDKRAGTVWRSSPGVPTRSRPQAKRDSGP